MCFYKDDYDWYATVVERSEVPSDKDRKCYECGRQIRQGEACIRVYLQEYEECQYCEDTFSDLYAEGHDCEGEHDYGEDYTYYCCMECEQLLTAIEAVETDDGCPAYSRRPAYEELQQSLWEHEDRWKYAERAVLMYPHLIDHPAIAHMLASPTA